MDTKILVVEDNALTSTLIKQTLSEKGTQIFLASNGQQGLEIVNSTSINLIITDVLMPIMDGVDFYKELKKNDRTKNIPIIIITDNKVFKDSFSTLGGVDDFLAKPINSAELLAKTSNILKLTTSQEKRGKIVIVSKDKEVCENMKKQLNTAGCMTIEARNSIELIEITLIECPKFILIDVLMEDLPARETIKALRCFMKLKDVKILTYTNFLPEELGDVDTIEHLKEAKNSCMEAGATKYIGRYTQTTFINNFYEYWD